MLEQLTAIDIFSGVGGLSLGAARAGLNLALAIERDPHALAAHKKNFRCTQHLSNDVAHLDAQSLLEAVGNAAPLVLLGGPPCQGFSTMGHRCATDPRNTLFLKFFKLVRELQPVLFLAENVPGILHPDNDELREMALGLVREDYRVLPPVRVAANDFGTATTRTRYLFIGYKTSHFDAFDGTALQSNAEPVSVADALWGLPNRILASWQSEEKSWRKVVYPTSDSPFWQRVRGRVPDGMGDPEAIRCLQEKSLVSGFLGTKHTPKVKARFARVEQGKTDRVAKARRLEWDGLCPTLRAGTGADRGSYQAVRPIHPSAHRVITPREAARLQGLLSFLWVVLGSRGRFAARAG